ncbi:hypothetical protein OSTOST_07290 [Ostertagia ostertagi]
MVLRGSPYKFSIREDCNTALLVFVSRKTLSLKLSLCTGCQGEGVPSSRLVSATSHIDAVRRFLKMVHVTIYARSEIDIEPDVIRREVAKLPATASSPRCKWIIVVQQYQGDSDLDRHTPPQRRVVNSPSKLNSQRMEMFEKKDQTSPTPSSSFSHHDKKVDSPLPAISSTFSSSVSSLHNSSNSLFFG